MKASRNYRGDTDCYAVSTIKCDDRLKMQYETAIAPKLDDGQWKVVETYETIEESESGHKKWFKAVSDFDNFDLDDHEEVIENYEMSSKDVKVEINY